MSCKHIQKQLVGGTSLSAEQLAHVDGCENCSAVSSQQRAVSRSLKMLAVAEPKVGAAERAFRAAIAGDSVISTPSFLERLLPVVTPIAAGATAAAVVALLLGSPTTTADNSADSGNGDMVATGLLSDRADFDDEAAAGELLALGDDE